MVYTIIWFLSDKNGNSHHQRSAAGSEISALFMSLHQRFVASLANDPRVKLSAIQAVTVIKGIHRPLGFLLQNQHENVFLTSLTFVFDIHD